MTFAMLTGRPFSYFVVMKSLLWILVACLWLVKPVFANQPTVITYLGPGDVDGYTRLALKLALDKSETEFGPYRLEFAPAMNEARARLIMNRQTYQHPIRRFETRTWVLKDKGLNVVPFPVYLGVYGFRVCVVSPETLGRFSQAKSLEDLRSFNHGQVQGWRDVEILRFNGFNVSESPSRESLYKKIAVNRVESFCRGAAELIEEKDFFDRIDNIVLDETTAFYYPFPFFFFTQITDKVTSQRVYKGLLNAYKDGSLMELWKEHHGPSLSLAKMHKRRIYSLKNPVVPEIKFDFEEFLYQPSKEAL